MFPANSMGKQIVPSKTNGNYTNSHLDQLGAIVHSHRYEWENVLFSLNKMENNDDYY